MNHLSFIVADKTFYCSLKVDSAFTVQSKLKNYRVTLDASADPFKRINSILAKNPRNLLLLDKNVYDLYHHQLVMEEDRIFIAKISESFKTLEGVSAVLDFLHGHQFAKDDTLIVVGGGITQDIGGFVSACYKRGISWILFPTTLLAMSDSCIGGKTGLNYRDAKNQIALFSPPSEVIINPAFLKTLPQEAIKSGLGEILKTFIMGGLPFLKIYRECVRAGRVVHPDHYQKLILGALSIKRAIVEADEFETHYRQCLNYGHTMGHAIEALSNYAIPHGSAVVIGMILENQLSVDQGLLSEKEHAELQALCLELLDKNMLEMLHKIDAKKLLSVLSRDKKMRAKEIHFALLKTLGEMYFIRLPLDDRLVGVLNHDTTKIHLPQPC